MQKTKRIKKVFSSFSKITHLWAHQTQSDAKCRNGFFNGPSIYSYGTHFLAGCIHEVKGQKVYVTTTRTYSNTTSNHMSHIRSAIPENAIHFQGINPSDLKKSVLEQQGNLIDKMFNEFNAMKFYVPYGHDLFFGNKDDSWDIIGQVERFNKNCELVGMPEFTLDIDDDFISLMNSHAQLRVNRQAELDAKRNTPQEIAKRAQAELRKQEREEKKQQELKEKALLNAQNWVAGGDLTIDMHKLTPQFIRIKDDQVETSRGATVPVSHAMRLLMRVLNNSVKQNDKVGFFQVDKIEGSILTIGCHKIDIEQAKTVLMKSSQNKVG